MQKQDSLVETAGRRDKDLIRLYASERSEAAFAELGRRYARLVYSTCLRETDDRTLAEDASQGVFLLLSQRIGTLKHCDNLAGWLYSASRYVAKNLVKQERRRRLYEAGAAENAAAQTDTNALWEQIEPHFHDSLNRLKPADREAVLLRFVQQESFASVGARLGIPENTARMRVSRALEKIRIRLSKAGIVVLAGALAVLLDAHASQAAPALLMQTVARIAGGTAAPITAKPVLTAARQFAWRAGARSRAAPLASVVGLFTLGYGYQVSQPRPASASEQRQLFATLAGAWSGSLEYADDRTHKHYTYPTKVIISDLDQGDTLQLAAGYVGTTSADVTTFTKAARSGQFAMRNGGPQSSHRLEGDAELMRLPDGDFAFQGINRATNAQTRIRIHPTASQLTIEEERRVSAWSRYQFRNRFSLRK